LHIRAIDMAGRSRKLILAALCAAAYGSASADGFDDMRHVWQARLTGGAAAAAAASDADVAGALSALRREAQSLLDRMDQAPDSKALWADAADWNNPWQTAASATVTTNYRRLAVMARAWATPGTSLHGDARLRDGVLYGLDWLDRHHYNAQQIYYGNWWDWQIGSPIQLLNTLVLMGDAVPPELLARCLAAIDHFVPEPDRHRLPDGRIRELEEKGANLLDKVQVVALRGVLGRSAAKVEMARDAVSPALRYVTSDDGFYADGSFIQHAHIAYTGNYGVVALEDMARLINLFKAGPWPLRDPNVANVYVWARESYVPMVYDGAMMNIVRGRKVSAYGQSDHAVGRSVAAALADLAQTASPADAQFLRAAVKGWMLRDGSFGPDYFGTPGDRAMALHELQLLKAIARDAQVAAAPEPHGLSLFPSMDRAVLRGPRFGVAFGLFSPRISAFEYGNRENARGWWSGIGMVSLYNADQEQFAGNYWVTIDAQRLPGITTDHSAAGEPREWNHYANRANWTGGAALPGGYGVLGMEFRMDDVTGSDLAGRKAWFMFGDKVLALGSGIHASRATETVVENRKGDYRLQVDGRELAVQLGHANLAAAGWAHLANGVAGADIGYCFPQHPSLAALREERSGRWSDIHSTQSKALVQDRYLSLALPHGAAPAGAEYRYIMLPGASSGTTAAYCANPRIVTEQNNDSVAAASERRAGVFAAAFWRGGATATLAGQPLLRSDLPAAVVLREEEGQLSLSVSDPTHSAGALTLDVLRPIAAAESSDPRVEVLQRQPTLRLRIRLDRTAGQAVQAAFRLADGAVVFPINPVK